MVLEFVKRVQISLQCTVGLAPLLRQYTSKDSISYSVLTVFTHWLVGTHIIPRILWALGIFWLYLSGGSFPALGSFLIHMCWSQTQGKPSADFQASLPAKLSSAVLYLPTPPNSSHLGSTPNAIYSFYSTWQIWFLALFGFFLLVLWPGHALQAVCRGIYRDLFIFSFPWKITVLCYFPMLLKPLFIYFIYFVWYFS